MSETELAPEETAAVFGADLASLFAERGYQVTRMSTGGIAVIDPHFKPTHYVQYVTPPKKTEDGK